MNRLIVQVTQRYRKFRLMKFYGNAILTLVNSIFIIAVGSVAHIHIKLLSKHIMSSFKQLNEENINLESAFVYGFCLKFKLKSIKENDKAI